MSNADHVPECTVITTESLENLECGNNMARRVARGAIVWKVMLNRAGDGVEAPMQPVAVEF